MRRYNICFAFVARPFSFRNLFQTAFSLIFLIQMAKIETDVFTTETAVEKAALAPQRIESSNSIRFLLYIRGVEQIAYTTKWMFYLPIPK